MTCKECNSELKEISFPKYIVYICVNWRCNLHREGQGIRNRETELKKYPSKTLQPGYSHWLWRKNINYHRLRSLGIPSKQAANDCSDKRTREILERVLA